MPLRTVDKSALFQLFRWRMSVIIVNEPCINESGGFLALNVQSKNESRTLCKELTGKLLTGLLKYSAQRCGYNVSGCSSSVLWVSKFLLLRLGHCFCIFLPKLQSAVCCLSRSLNLATRFLKCIGKWNCPYSTLCSQILHKVPLAKQKFPFHRAHYQSLQLQLSPNVQIRLLV